ncbi:transcription elongation factor Spt5 [Sulfolobus tengchongensis]|uniref:Transcription elongation factor Spt5 n=1 Tax=Sulfolobus tengchongensis TaxID=207809 RepID=A0AAX4KYT7_9CREN
MEKPNMRNYYAVKVIGGQEINVALMLEERIKTNNIKGVYAIIVPPNLKGYVILEAEGLHVVKTLISGIRNARGLAQGLLPRDEILKIVSRKTVGPIVKPGDIVEVVSGPFRGTQAQVVRVEEAKGEVVLNILESAFPLQVTVPLDQIKVSKR